MKKKLYTLLFAGFVVSFLCCSSSDPIHLHPKNPHYFEWKGEPTVLITSAEHYGAVLNLDYEFEPYFHA